MTEHFTFTENPETQMFRKAFLPLFVLLFVHCPTTLVSGSEVASAKSAPSISAIDAAMQEFVNDNKASGVVTLVAHKGKIVHLGAVGMSNIQSKTEMKPTTLFSIASMTKPIVATGVMILQEEGKLSIDDKVSKYIPAFADLKLNSGESPSREITIRDALTHTSGLAGSQVFPGSLKEAIDELSKRPLAFQPGSKWQYSPGLNVAGRIIEIVSKQSLETFMQQRIFQPLGMKDTTFVPDRKQQRRIATIYAPGKGNQSLRPVDNFITDFSNVKGANPSGGLVSSANDLFRFYQMVLNKGEFHGQRILSAKTVQQVISPQTGDLKTGFTPGNCWGLGWCIVREPQGVSEMLSAGTFGHGGAFGTQGWVDPKTKTIYVLLIQRTKFGNSDASELRKRLQQLANDALGL